MCTAGGETPLRGMEIDVVEKLVTEMREAGINIVRGESTAISGGAGGPKTLTCKDGSAHGGYDEVLIATGRET